MDQGAQESGTYLALVVPAAQADEAALALWTAGARAIQELDASRGLVELRTELRDACVTELRAALRPGWTLQEPDRPPVLDTWRAHFVPWTAGDITVVLPESGFAPAADIVVVEPGNAFGTAHATTRGAAHLLVQVLDGLGDRPAPPAVLDVGTGTGVLALIAAAHGADVGAVDTSAEAVALADANVARNGLQSQISVRRGSVGAAPRPANASRFDIVIANLLLADQRAVATDIGRLAPMFLIVAGVLDSQLDQLVQRYPDREITGYIREAGWTGAVLSLPR